MRSSALQAEQLAEVIADDPTLTWQPRRGRLRATRSDEAAVEGLAGSGDIACATAHSVGNLAWLSDSPGLLFTCGTRRRRQPPG